MAAVAVAAAAAFAASSVPGRGVPTTASAAAENSVSKSSSDIRGSPVVVLIFFCMSGVCLLICLLAIITIKIEKYFNFFQSSISW